jgi:uncharacterized membrane protein YjjP (DUF1212 family)
VLRVEPGSVDLARMTMLVRLGRQVADGEVTVGEALARLLAPRRPVPAWALHAGYAGTSASAAVLLGGGVSDVLGAIAVGFCASLLLVRLQRVALWAPLADLAAATFVALLAGAVAALGPSRGVVTLAALVVLVPGLSLTVAISELASRSWVAGTSRLAGVTVGFLELAAGVAVGWRLTEGVPVLFAAGPPTPALAHPLALLAAPVAFLPLFRGRPRDLPVTVVVSACGFLLAAAIGGPFGAAFGALVVGVAGNAHARLTGVPSSVVVMPGVLLLLPGLVGLRGVSAMFGADLVGGLDVALDAVTTAGALVAGLLAAHAMLPAKRAL